MQNLCCTRGLRQMVRSHLCDSERSCLPGRLHRLFFLLSVVALGGAGVLVTSLRVSADGPPATATRRTDRPMPGSLVICGGGAMPASVIERFMELAGGRE